MSAELISSDSGIKILELLGSKDQPRINAMLELYERFFPEYAHYIPRMRRRVEFPSKTRRGHRAHYWLVEYNDTPVGLSTFRYISSRKCGLGVSFALDPSVRSIKINEKPLSAFVISKIMEQLEIDSAAMGNTELFGLVTEVEHVRLMQRYKKFGMIELPIQYLEPIFPPETDYHQHKEKLSGINFIPVFLGITPNPEIPPKKFTHTIIKDFALAFLVDHYNLDENHPRVQEVIRSIYERKEVPR